MLSRLLALCGHGFPFLNVFRNKYATELNVFKTGLHAAARSLPPVGEWRDSANTAGVPPSSR